MAPAISDEDVLALANSESAVLLTADTDFGELVYRQGQLATAVILLRLAGLSPNRKAEVVSLAIREHAGELAMRSPSSVRARFGFVGEARRLGNRSFWAAPVAPAGVSGRACLLLMPDLFPEQSGCAENGCLVSREKPFEIETPLSMW